MRLRQSTAQVYPTRNDGDNAALERLAGGLGKVTHPGPAAKDIANAFRADAPGTVAEFTVVRDALAKSGTPEQVRNLTEGVRAELRAICDAPGTYVKVRSDEVLPIDFQGRPPCPRPPMNRR